MEAGDIHMDELKAIVQQCKELVGFSESIPITTYERLRGEIKELKQENEELKEELQLSKESGVHVFVDDDMLIEQNKKLKEEKEEIQSRLEKLEKENKELRETKVPTYNKDGREVKIQTMVLSSEYNKLMDENNSLRKEIHKIKKGDYKK